MTTQRTSTLGSGHELRALSHADADELHALIERNRPRLARWMSWAHTQTPDDTDAFIRRAEEKAREGRGFHRCIVADGRIAGVAGFSTIDALNRSGAIGYWLDEDHQGRGLMTAAVAALTDHAFEHFELNRAEISADVENRASRAIAERLGFSLEGVARQAYRIVGERYSDDAVYSMLACDPARAELARFHKAGAPVEQAPRR
ncbi:MAG: ribosomal-protein-serine acetyltransferase [Solirubrobacteraceae bacterium]|nr:ribosomal-protein-serine acetyltransferase [Solirubrobacteraceae bacterium]